MNDVSRHETLRLPMRQKDLEALLPSQQWQLYLDGSRDVLVDADKMGIMKLDYGDLSFMLDGIRDGIEEVRDENRQERLAAQLSNLAFLENSPSVLRLHRQNGIDVEYEEGEASPRFYSQIGNEYTHLPTTEEKSPDERFADNVIRKMNSQGYYAECGGMTNDGRTTYYAIVLPRKKFDSLIAEAQETYHASQSWDGRPDDSKVDWSMLSWETMVSLPNFVDGAETRAAALRASAQPYMQSSKTTGV